LVFDIGLLILAELSSLILKVDFGILLFLLGILIGGLGAYLGGPNPNDPDNPRNRPFQYLNRPNERLADQGAYNAKHSVPIYAFENAMAVAGLIAAILSIPFVIQIMFSK
jgi:hypothetical protein